jgi:hypothetical protein
MADDFALRLAKIKQAKEAKDQGKSVNSSAGQVISDEKKVLPKVTAAKNEQTKEFDVDNNGNDAINLTKESEEKPEEKNTNKNNMKENNTNENNTEERNTNENKMQDNDVEDDATNSISLSEIMETQQQILLVTQTFVDSVNKRLDAIEKRVTNDDAGNKGKNTEEKKSDVYISKISKLEKENCSFASWELKKISKRIDEIREAEDELSIQCKRLDELEERFEMISEVMGLLPDNSSNDVVSEMLVSKSAGLENSLSLEVKALSIVKSQIANVAFRVSNLEKTAEQNAQKTDLNKDKSNDLTFELNNFNFRLNKNEENMNYFLNAMIILSKKVDSLKLDLSN